MKVQHMSEADCYSRAQKIALDIKQFFPSSKPLNIFGVPRGGIPVAYMVVQAIAEYERVARVVYCAADAEIIVDDLIDSGATRNRYRDKPFFVLLDKHKERVEDTWVVFPWESTEVRPATDIPLRFLQYIGEDPNRPGLLESPGRVVRSWDQLYGGYKINPKDLFKTFDEQCDQMVIVRNIEFYSMCEHHFLPFFGKAHIAYIPNHKVVGVSKLARLVDCFARRLQIQERLTQQITSAIDEHLHPHGVACFIEAQHLCMMARGVEKQNSVMITSSLLGQFKEKDSTRIEFLLLNGRGGING